MYIGEHIVLTGCKWTRMRSALAADKAIIIRDVLYLTVFLTLIHFIQHLPGDQPTLPDNRDMIAKSYVITYEYKHKFSWSSSRFLLHFAVYVIDKKNCILLT